MTKLIRVVSFRSFTNEPNKEMGISRDLTIFYSKQFPVVANTSCEVLHGPYTARFTHQIKNQHLAHIPSSLVCPFTYLLPYILLSLSRCPRGLRHRPAAPRLLILRVRISLGVWIFLLWLVYVVQVEVCATGRSFVQRSTAECIRVHVCDQMKQ